MISDFLDPKGFEPGLKMLASMGHDVFVVHVASQRDRDPGALGDVRFVDAETGELRDVDVTPALAAAYGEAWQAHADELETFCGRYNLGYVRADAEAPFEEIILQDVPQGTVPRMSFGAMAAWQALLLIAAPRRAAAWLFRMKVRPPRDRTCRRCCCGAACSIRARELTWWERVRRAVSLAATVARRAGARARRRRGRARA